MAVVRWIKILLIAALVAIGALLLYGHARRHPEDLPWTKLDLTRRIGIFTGRKLTALDDDPGRCRHLLRNAGVAFARLPPQQGGQDCGYRDAVRLRPEGALAIAFRPAGLGTSCPVAAALALWEWHVVQPAALRHLGSKVTAIEHFGSYNCRRISGRPQAGWSEHATANAVDIAAFRLADGRRIAVARDWADGGPEAAFLHEVRDGACRLFATVLSPEYNPAHASHFHFDQAARGSIGWRACR